MIKQGSFIDKLIKFSGKCSYEVYLVQLVVFVILPINKLRHILPINLIQPIWMVVTILASFMGGFLLWLLFNFNNVRIYKKWWHL